MTNDFLSKENRELVDKMIDRRLTPEEYEVFERRLHTDSTFADFYIDNVLTHSALSLIWSDSDLSDDKERLFESDHQVVLTNRKMDRKEIDRKINRRLFLVPGILTLLLLSVLLLCLLGLFFHGTRGETTFATITVTKGCLWENSTAQTPPGSRLGPSELNLKDGISQIDFDCGAVVRIEGPCRFELVAPKECILHGGKAVIEAVSEQAKGFVMITPTTVIKDVGTAFHVHVPEDGTTDVFVLKGRVDVRSRNTGETAVLLQGDAKSFLSGNGRRNPPVSARATGEQRMLQISTTFGRGREESVIFGADQFDTATGKPLVRSPEYMQVKTSIPTDLKSNRKAFFRFDMESSDIFSNDNMNSVSLLLSYGPTRLGFAAFVPDATFIVYGYVGEADDFWNEEPLVWNSIPGNELRNEMDATLWRPLGSFTIAQGDISGSVRLETEELVQFMNEKRLDKTGRGKTMTFALVRETEAEQISGMVHGFANRYHSELSPPRLVFYYSDN